MKIMCPILDGYGVVTLRGEGGRGNIYSGVIYTADAQLSQKIMCPILDGYGIMNLRGEGNDY